MKEGSRFFSHLMSNKGSCVEDGFIHISVKEG